MSSAQFGWESLLHSNAPPKSSLKAALFTTYDRAEERLLAEHMLPLFLKLNREPESDGKERQYFLLELDHRLKQLHDRIVVVSSTAREEPGDSEENESRSYDWIWRSIRRLTVGCNGKAVQHAKLWLLHWGATDTTGEYIEIIVSSANLTRGAFKGQIQAGWRTCLELHPQITQTRRSRWGVLPEFLSELAKSAGDPDRLTLFGDLLARADCPEDIEFVASVPGKHNRQTLQRTPWGAEGLRKIVPPGRGSVGVSILTPYIGSWDRDQISHWCSTYEGIPNRLELVWIDKSHPWKEHWLLPKIALAALNQLGATLRHLRYEPNSKNKTDLFHKLHRCEDVRWSHAKAYSFKRGNSRRLLVTSANFSPAAWGRRGSDGLLTIDNFELGVCIDKATWPFDGLEVFDNVNDAATVSQLVPNRDGTIITWTRAAWDGEAVRVECRCKAELAGELICGSDERTPINKWTLRDHDIRTSETRWIDPKRPPLYVQLRSEPETVRVLIFDERKVEQRRESVVPELDEHVVQSMKDELLFEQYGGRLAGEDNSSDEDQKPIGVSPEVTPTDNGLDKEHARQSTDSYAVPALVLAREHLSIVDNWAKRLKDAEKSKDGELKWLLRDGEHLSQAFERLVAGDTKRGPASSIGAKLAAEEMKLRLNQSRKDV